MKEPAVTYVIVNNLGGITSLVINLIRYKGPSALRQELLMLDIAGNHNAPAEISREAGLASRTFKLNPKHNWYDVYGRLATELSHQEGVIVSNDMYDLITLTQYNVPAKVVQIVHDAYNIKLSLQFGDVVDVFICHSLFYYEALCQLLHDRRKDIFHIPYGIPLSGAPRASRMHDQPLRLLFLGRHDQGKGIFDLYAIQQELKKRNIAATWLILGKGPETVALKEQWKEEKAVQFLTPASNEEVLQLAAECDVFVFPTKFEGFPVALVETMSVGVVPVASDLPGGIRELILNGETGYRCTMDDILSFAHRIEALHRDRDLLEKMSRKAHSVIYDHYNAEKQSPKYQELFKKVAGRKGAPLHHRVKKKLGSRLDQPWLPNSIVKLLRKAHD